MCWLEAKQSQALHMHANGPSTKHLTACEGITNLLMLTHPRSHVLVASKQVALQVYTILLSTLLDRIKCDNRHEETDGEARDHFAESGCPSHVRENDASLRWRGVGAR